MMMVRTRHKPRRAHAKGRHPTPAEAAAVREAFSEAALKDCVEMTAEELRILAKTGEWPERLK
jgi:hypothetical protein